MSQAGSTGKGGGAGAIITIAGDTGTISGNHVTIYAHRAVQNSGSTVGFDNSGTVSTLNLTDSNGNTILGNVAGNSGTGYAQNVGLGQDALQSLTTSSFNVAIGTGSLSGLTGPIGGAGSNTALGLMAGGALLTGSGNTFLGANTGSAYTGAESNNILLGNAGVNGESRVMRLGNPTGGASIQETFLAGVTGVTVSGSAPTAVNSSGQLSSLGFGTATQVLTSNGAGNSPTWQAGGGGGSSVYFSAYLSTPQANVTGDGTTYTIVCDTALSNVGSAYSTGTGLFTAPSTGFYFFNKTTAYAGLVAQTSIINIWTGSVYQMRSLQEEGAFIGAGGTYITSESWSIPMTAGDTMSIQANAGGSTKTAIIYGAVPTAGTLPITTTFSGWKVA